MKDVLWAIAEDYEDTTGEKAYEFERSIDHHGGENVEDILALLDTMGY